jgi:hypothetical protein
MRRWFCYSILKLIKTERVMVAKANASRENAGIFSSFSLLMSFRILHQNPGRGAYRLE